MKRLFILIAALIFLTGCSTVTQVQRRVVVHAIGIDPHEKGFEVSYQIFSGGEASSGGPVDASESTVVTLLAQGRNLYETEESLRLQTGKEVFLGDTELIVISEELFDEPLEPLLDYFRRSDIYLGVNVVYCRGSAQETIGAKLNQNSATAILLRGVIESAIEAGRACSSRIIEISNAVRGKQALPIPILSLEREDSGDSKETSLTDLTVGVFNSLVVSHSGSIGEIGENCAMGIRLLRGDVSEMSLTVPTGEGYSAVQLEELGVSRSVSIKDGAPVIRVSITGQCSLRYGGDNFSEAKAAAEKQILSLCGEAFEKQRDLGEDLTGVLKLLRRYESGYAESIENDPERAVKEAVFEISCDLGKYSP